jgi:hypothetical protein
MNPDRIVVRCCVCHRVEADKVWRHLAEVTLRDKVFSHGYCPPCYRAAMARMTPWPSGGTIGAPEALELQPAAGG